jgi:hypothetical protein
MARTLLAGPTTATGAGVFAPLRVVGLSIQGSFGSEGALDDAALRRWVTERQPLPAYAAADPAFAIEVVSGPDPALRIVAAGAVSEGDAHLILRHARAWLTMQTTWRTGPDHDGAPVSLATHAYSPALPSMPLVRPGKTGAQAKSFPYEIASARATLLNAMRSLAARVPLREVVLTVPEPVC